MNISKEQLREPVEAKNTKYKINNTIKEHAEVGT